MTPSALTFPQQALWLWPTRRNLGRLARPRAWRWLQRLQRCRRPLICMCHCFSALEQRPPRGGLQCSFWSSLLRVCSASRHHSCESSGIAVVLRNVVPPVHCPSSRFSSTRAKTSGSSKRFTSTMATQPMAMSCGCNVPSPA